MATEDSNKILSVKPCAFCKKCPELKISCWTSTNWLVVIRCKTCEDYREIRTKEFSIRKSQRFKPDWIEKKVSMCIDSWNELNEEPLIFGYVLDFEKMAREGLK